MSDAFLGQRERLWGLAYRMLGSRADADDVVQDAWLRWQRSDQAAIERPAAWLTTVTSRLAIDRLRARRVESERYVGPWLPEPISLAAVDDPTDLADSITVGFLALLERLDPVERVVFLLADVFREPFADIAVAVGRSDVACRQLASRARRRIHDPERNRGRTVTRAEQQQLVQAFSMATVGGDLDAIAALLAPEVVLVSDGGADHHAARRPVVGPDRVARLLANLAKRLPPELAFRAEEVNGEPGLVFLQDGRVVFVVVLHITDRGIEDVFIVVNPDKLHSLTAGAAAGPAGP